jgi:hypothetical protein
LEDLEDSDSDSEWRAQRTCASGPGGTSLPGVWSIWSEAEDSANLSGDSDSGKDSDDDEEEEEEEEEGDLVLNAVSKIIGQPTEGWTKAESSLPRRKGTGCKAPLSNTAGACWARKKKAKERMETEKTLHSTYGTISNFFSPVVRSEPQATTLSATSNSSQRLFIAPNFDEPEDKNLEKELSDDIVELELWIKKNKPNLTSPWGKRVDSLLRLLKRQQYRVQLSEDKSIRSRELIEDSEGIAVEINKRKKYAKCLRRWKRDWTQSRTLPPKLHAGAHVKSESLYDDEGVLVAVREYLNKAKSVTPKGVCDTVCKLLQSRRVANLMGMENLLSSEISTGTTTSESTLRRKGISLTTAKRWLGKLGWIYSRDGKGYVDGHEREDVVQYRETVFIPHWLVRTSIYY